MKCPWCFADGFKADKPCKKCSFKKEPLNSEVKEALAVAAKPHVASWLKKFEKLCETMPAEIGVVVSSEVVAVVALKGNKVPTNVDQTVKRSCAIKAIDIEGMCPGFTSGTFEEE